MKRNKKHHLWLVGTVSLTLLFFLAGTSLACLQKGIGTIKMAEECCQSHCQHAMSGEAATGCCQSQHAQASPVFPSSSPAKTLVLVAILLPVSLLSPAVSQGLDQSCSQRSIEEHSPPSPLLYALHCTLLI